MSRPEFIIVTGQDGLRGIIETPPPEHDLGPMAPENEYEQPHALLPADEPLVLWLDSGERRLLPRSALARREDGTYALSGGRAELQPQDDKAIHFDREEQVLPVVQEQLHLGKRRLETARVRVTKRTKEHTETVNQPLLRETMEIVRVPVNRVIDTPPAIRHEGDTLIMSVLEEVLVTEKRLILKEEVHITRRRAETSSPEQVVLRSEEVIVERIPA